jgi:hypothetical protein
MSFAISDLGFTVITSQNFVPYTVILGSFLGKKIVFMPESMVSE